MAFFEVHGVIDFYLHVDDVRGNSRRDEYNQKERDIFPCLTIIHLENEVKKRWEYKKIGPRTYEIWSPSGLGLNFNTPKNPIGHFPLNTTQVKRPKR